MLTLLLGLASFIFGPQYIIIPIVSLLLGFITGMAKNSIS